MGRGTSTSTCGRAKGRGRGVGDDQARAWLGNSHQGCKHLRLHEASANPARLNLGGGGGGVLPLANGELSAEPKKVLKRR